MCRPAAYWAMKAHIFPIIMILNPMNLNFIDGDDNNGAGNNVPVNRDKISK